MRKRLVNARGRVILSDVLEVLVKLSAPPPPPPEPNEPNQPITEGIPTGEVTADIAETPPDVPVIPKAPSAVWPGWFSGADFALGVATFVLAFLAASFLARNSDVWVHLASGKRLLAGEYVPGSDPFSFAPGDRTWVNHSIFFDAAAYLIHGDAGTGGALVAVKAFLVAMTFVLLMLIRRPSFPLWPWAATAAIAVLASTPYFQLRPFICSMLLLAITLLLLFRMPHVSGAKSWRFPIAFGVLCWVWANTDEWFFVGPLAVSLVLLGELVQGSKRKTEGSVPSDSPEKANAETELMYELPLGPLPDVPTLVKALVIGLLACMLNPHHIGVWQVPFELSGPKELTADPRLRQLFLTPLDRLYVNNAPLGYNLNGFAFGVLLIGGGALLALGSSRLRLAHVALWIGFAGLSLLTIYAIPFLAIVAVPIIASQLNGLSARTTLKTWGDPKTRFLLLGSAGGRVLSLMAVLLGCVFAWPGWIHPPSPNPAYVRHVAWEVEADPAMVRAARQLQSWRESGRLPAEAHGIIASVELANYCAWFAPLEKVFVNSRFNYHRPDWADYLAVRNGMRLIPSDELPDRKAFEETLKRHNAQYVGLHSGPGDSYPLRSLATLAIVNQWNEPSRWSPWFFDGRSALTGWRFANTPGQPTFDSLRVDPIMLAFGPDVQHIPQGQVLPAPVAGGWEDAFVRAPSIPPPGADEAIMWRTYQQFNQQLLEERQMALRVTAFLADRITGMAGVISRVLPTMQPSEGTRAIPFLALRAARTAIASVPDSPDGYYALYQAVSDPNLPISDSDRVIAQITALRQCLDRLPPPEEFRLGRYSASPTQVAAALAEAYLGRRREYDGVAAGLSVGGPGFGILTGMDATGVLVVEGNRPVRVPALSQRAGQGAIAGPFLLPLDLAREAFLQAQEYARYEFGIDPERAKAIVEAIGKDVKNVETELARANNAFETRRAAQKLPEQIRLALQYNLAGEALKLLTSRDMDPSRDFGQEAISYLLTRVALQMAVGRLADAARDLEQLAADSATQQQLAVPQIRDTFRALLYQRFLLEGNYPDAGKMLEEMDGPVIREDRNREVRAKFNSKPFLAIKPSVEDWAKVSLFAAIASPTTFDLVARSFAPLVAANEFLALQADLKRFRDLQTAFFFRRGLLYLFEGDIPEAERRFLLTRLPAVPDWGLPDYRHSGAEQYLAFIALARERVTKK